MNAVARVLAVVAVGSTPVFGADSVNADDGTDAAAPDAWHVYQFLHTHCAECHGGHLSKPKASLGYILDLPRLIEDAYVIPGEPENSDLYLALTTDDPDLKMPPDDSEGPKPDAAAIEEIRLWIAGGAVTGADEAPVAASSGETPPTAAGEMSFARKIGRLHPLLVHFPIAFLFAAGVAGLLGRNLSPDHWLQGLIRGSLWIGTAGALVAGVCGWLNASFEGFSGDAVDTHRWLGITTGVIAVTALLFWERAARRSTADNGKGRAFVLALLVIATVLVTLAGHTGGQLSYGPDYLPFF